VNNLPEVVTQRHLEQDLSSRPVDHKPKRLTHTPPRHLATYVLTEYYIYRPAWSVEYQTAVLCSNEVKVTRYCAKVTFVYFLLVTK